MVDLVEESVDMFKPDCDAFKNYSQIMRMQKL